MEPRVLDGALFLSMVALGHQHLEANKEVVNSLNVFPVPDGDTGTNMSLSLGAGVEEMRRFAGQSIGSMADALSKGLLMGARGNSGVILSQLMRGFAKSVMKLERIDAKGFADGLQQGVQTAYAAVVKPVEGTILTVAKDAARFAQATAKADDVTLADVMKAALQEAEASLARTPDLLPVLKQANVVDSGGQGLVFVYRGFLAALTQSSEFLNADARQMQSETETEVLSYPIPHGMPAPAYRPVPEFGAHGEDEFGYCTEFIVRFDQPLEEESMERMVREAMQPLGDSLLVVAAQDVVKVHIHAEMPGQVLNKAIEWGPLVKIKIDNMTEQHHHLSHHYDPDGTVNELDPKSNVPVQGGETAAVPASPVAVVAVAAGEGLQEIFTSIGVVSVVSGGQTMNPSTEDLMRAVELTGSEHVFILPNNSNIVMAARQAAELMEGRITVIPTTSIPQGLAAALAFDPARPAAETEERMLAAASRILSGQITQAVRTTQYQENEIREGDYLGLKEGKVVAVTDNLNDCLLKLFESILDPASEIATLFYGEGITDEMAEACVELLQSHFTNCEFEIHYGGQPLYPFLISVE